MAGLLGGDPRPVFAAAGALTLLTVAVAWFAGLRREHLPASVLTRRPGNVPGTIRTYRHDHG